MKLKQQKDATGVMRLREMEIVVVISAGVGIIARCVRIGAGLEKYKKKEGWG